jgi:hypothetical protein
MLVEIPDTESLPEKIHPSFSVREGWGIPLFKKSSIASSSAKNASRKVGEAFLVDCTAQD